MTYKQLNDTSNRLAHRLLDLGVKHKDLVAVYLPKSPEKVISIFAILKTGATCVVLNSIYKKDQVDEILDGTDLKLLIRSRNPALDTDITCLYDDEISGLADLPDHDPGIDISSDTPGIVIFTSGSTGRSKGVVISHDNLSRRTEGEINSFDLTASDRILNILPFSFDVGLNQLLTSLCVGATLVLHNFVFEKSLFDLIDKENITGISGVPSLWIRLMQSYELISRANLDSLRYITVSGGSLTKKQLLKLKEYLNSISIIKTYGQTETFRSALLKGDQFDEHIDSLGMPPEGVRTIILDDDHKPCAPDKIGELVHMGVGSMSGYLDDDELTRRKIIDVRNLGLSTHEKYGVLTGDLFSADERGYLYYHGRKDDMLKISGYRVYVQEIEKGLCSHDAVKEAAVIPDGEELHAFVTIKEGRPADESMLLDHCRHNMPFYMVPKQIHIISEMPRTGPGKIDKQTLRRR